VFLAAGGEQYDYIPALNARADHVAVLSALVSREVNRAAGATATQESAACFG
jgi:protoheme ferro-lyase